MKAMIRFGKNPRLRFVSHLYLQRFFQRALNRTGLPIAFSQGFNPHPVMSFASALAMGWTSEYEVVEFGLEAPVGKAAVEEAVKASLPEDLPVLETRLVEDRHPAPMAQVRMADYRIVLSGADGESVLEAAEEFLNRGSVLAVRKTKSGEREIDVRPLAVLLAPMPGELRARLMLTEKDTLKPDLLVKTLAQIAGVETPEVRIHRLTLLGQDAAGNPQPLMKL